MDKDFDEEYKDRFNKNYQLEDGTMVPSRASTYVAMGIKKYYDSADDMLLFMLCGSSMDQPLYDKMAKDIELGKITELECMKALISLGEDIGKEMAEERSLANG